MKSIKLQSISANSGSTYLLEKFEIKLKNTFLKTFSAVFMIPPVALLWLPSYAELYNTVCEEPLYLKYGIY